MLNMMPFTQHTSTQTDTDITSQVARIHVYMNLYLQRTSIYRNPATFTKFISKLVFLFTANAVT